MKPHGFDITFILAQDTVGFLYASQLIAVFHLVKTNAKSKVKQTLFSSLSNLE